jgi:hypothetical protein
MSAAPKVIIEKLSLYLLAQELLHEFGGDIDKATKRMRERIRADEEYVEMAIHSAADTNISRATVSSTRRAFSQSFEQKRSPVMDTAKIQVLSPGDAKKAGISTQTRPRSPTYMQPVDELETFYIVGIKIRELRVRDLRKSISMRTSRRATDLRVIKFQTELLKLFKSETKTLGQSSTDTDIWNLIRKHGIQKVDL